MEYVQILNVPNRLPDRSMNTPTIFLAGPTPRNRDVPSWRPEFIDILERQEVLCTALVPETDDGWWHGNYDEQCEWEYHYLNQADFIAFWVPRDLETMPAFTTNVEFGYWVRSMKTFYGRPDGAPKTRYLDWMFTKFHGNTNSIPTSMEGLVDTLKKYVSSGNRPCIPVADEIKKEGDEWAREAAARKKSIENITAEDLKIRVK